MAGNTTKITEIIDERAFAQWKAFVDSLEQGQSEMAKLVQEVAQLNKAIGSAGSMKDLKTQTESLNKALSDLDDARKRMTATEEKLAKAEEQLVKLAKEKADALNKESVATKDVAASSGKYTGTLSDAVVRVAELKKEMAGLNASYKANKDNMPIEAAAQYEQQMSLLKAELLEANKEVRNQAKEINETSGAFQSSLTPYQEYSKQVKLAKDEAKDLGAELIALKKSGSGTDEEINDLSNRFNVAQQNAAKLDKEIKELDESVGDSQRNVGNYKSAFDGALGSINILGVNLGQLSKSIEEQISQGKGLIDTLKAQAAAEQARAAATATATTATNASTKSLGVLKLALIATGIGAIVVAVGALAAAFLSTQRGADALTRTLEPLKAIFQGIIGVVQNLATDIVDAFKNPQQALKDLGKAILDNIVNRFTAVGVILDGIANRDFSKITNGLAQMGTGVENVNGKLKKGVDFLKEQAKVGSQIAEKSIQLEKSQNNLNYLKDKYEDKERALLLISKDTSKSFKERAAAANEIIKITQEYAIEEAKVKQIEIDRLKLQQSLNDTKRQGKGSQEELIKLEMELDDINDKTDEKRLEQTKVLSGLKKEQNQIANEGADIEAKRLAEIKELNRSEIEQIQFVLAEKLKALKIDKDASKLTKEELGARVALEKEANAKIAELNEVLQDRLRDLATKRAEFERDTLEDVARINLEASKDESLGYVDRLASLKDYLDAKQLVIDADNKIELSKLDNQRREAKKLLLDGKIEEYQALSDIILIEEEKISKLTATKRIELAEKTKNDVLALTKEEYKDRAEWEAIAFEENYANETKILAELYKKKEIDEKTFLEKRAALQRKYAEDTLDAQIKDLETLRDVLKANGGDVADLEKQLAKLRIQQSKLATDAIIEDLEKIAEADKKLREQRVENANFVLDKISAFSDSLAGFYNAISDNQLQNLEKEQEINSKREEDEVARIENSTLTEEQKEARIFAIRQKYAQLEEQNRIKQNKVKQKQAKIDKANAAMQITINTAMGVAAALGQLNIPLAAIIGALGAIELATVLATKIPAFYKGTGSSPEGLAMVGERGSELMVTPDGKAMLTPPTETLTYLQKGTKIFTADQTRKILADQAKLDSMHAHYNMDVGALINAQSQSTKELKKAFKDNATRTIITKRGLHSVQMRNSKVNNYLRRNGL